MPTPHWNGKPMTTAECTQLELRHYLKEERWMTPLPLVLNRGG